jgi:hypothetical protein
MVIRKHVNKVLKDGMNKGFEGTTFKLPLTHVVIHFTFTSEFFFQLYTILNIDKVNC